MLIPILAGLGALYLSNPLKRKRRNPKKRRSTRKSRAFLSFRPRIGRFTKKVLPRTAPGFVAYHNGNAIAAGSSRAACKADLRAVRARSWLPYRPVSIRQVQDWRMYQHNPKRLTQAEKDARARVKDAKGREWAAKSYARDIKRRAATAKWFAKKKKEMDEHPFFGPVLPPGYLVRGWDGIWYPRHTMVEKADGMWYPAESQNPKRGKKRRRNPAMPFEVYPIAPGAWRVRMHVGRMKGKHLPSAPHSLKEGLIEACRAVISSYKHKSGATLAQHNDAVKALADYGTRY